MRPEKVQPLHGTLAVAAIGIAFSTIAFFSVAGWEERTAARAFTATAQDHARTLQHGLDDYVGRLVGLRALFNAAKLEVARQEFRVFTENLIGDSAGLLSLSWIPRVTDAGRQAHETAARADGIADYQIYSVDAEGKKLGGSPPREEYYPVFYTTLPLDSRAYGLDLKDGSIRQRPLEYARDNDMLAATGNFPLQSGVGGSPYGFFVVLPIYRPDMSHATVEDRRRNIAGYVQGVFQFHVIADVILKSVKAPVNFFLFEGHADPTDLPVYVRKNGAASEDRVAKNYVMAEQPSWTGDLRIGDRRWEVVVIPAGGASSLARHNRAWILLGAGLLITALVCAYVWTTTRYMRILEAANRAVSELARTDALTGLPNRRSFVERLELAFAGATRGGRSFAVHYIDLDGFKAVNDSQGHAAGDALLKEVGRRLAGLVRSTDLVARFGGDEFAVLQSAVETPAAASALGAKIIELLSAPYRLGGIEFNVTASLGIARYGLTAQTPESLMMQADLALYAAKTAGRRRFCLYSPEIETKHGGSKAVRETRHAAA